MNTDIRLQVTFLRHPKIRRLRHELGAEGVLCLLSLWLFTAQHRPHGELRGMDDQDIEIAGEWSGTPGAFVEALRNLRLLDRKGSLYVVHDWKENNPWVAGAPKRSAAAKKANEVRWSKRLGKMVSDSEKSGVRNDPVRNPPILSSPILTNSISKEVSDDTSKQQKPAKKEGFVLPEWIPSEPWNAFVEMRKKIRKPLTEQAAKLAVKKLKELDIQGHRPEDVLNQSVLMSWQGLFAVKQETQQRQVQQPISKGEARRQKNLEASQRVLESLEVGDAEIR